jgi:tRNA nucleotidyltransferase (CCA-adding enzyme)
LLLHDLGKGRTDRSQWPSHIGHERRGLPLVERVCERWRAPNEWRDLALNVCGLHLRCHQVLQMRPVKIMALLEEGDFLRRPDSLAPFLQACEADYRGRTGLEERPYPQSERLTAALEAVQNVRARDLDTDGLDGRAIGELLRSKRIEAIGALTGGETGPAG